MILFILDQQTVVLTLWNQISYLTPKCKPSDSTKPQSLQKFTLNRTFPVRGLRLLILKRPFFPNVIKCFYVCNFPHAMYFLIILIYRFVFHVLHATLCWKGCSLPCSVCTGYKGWWLQICFRNSCIHYSTFCSLGGHCWICPVTENGFENMWWLGKALLQDIKRTTALT